MDHPAQRRRRRHKSPSNLLVAQLPVPRLADHLDTVDGPSDKEGEKDAKRQRSEPTTPISTASRPPHEYDEVMGITQVEQREAERFEEGVEPEFQDTEEQMQSGKKMMVSRLGLMSLGDSHGDLAVPPLESVWIVKINMALMPLLPVTLGLRLRECLTRRRL